MTTISMNSSETTANTSLDETISFIQTFSTCCIRVTASMESSCMDSRERVENIIEVDMTNLHHIKSIESERGTIPFSLGEKRKKSENKKRSNSAPIKNVESQTEDKTCQRCKDLSTSDLTGIRLYSHGIAKKKMIAGMREKKQNYRPQLILETKRACASLSKSGRSRNIDTIDSKPCDFIDFHEVIAKEHVIEAVLKTEKENTNLADAIGLKNGAYITPPTKPTRRYQTVRKTSNKILVDRKQSEQCDKISDPTRAKDCIRITNDNFFCRKKSIESKRFQQLYALSKPRQEVAKKRREDIAKARERANEAADQPNIKISLTRAIKISNRLYDQGMKQLLSKEDNQSFYDRQ